MYRNASNLDISGLGASKCPLSYLNITSSHKSHTDALWPTHIYTVFSPIHRYNWSYTNPTVGPLKRCKKQYKQIQDFFLFRIIPNDVHFCWYFSKNLFCYQSSLHFVFFQNFHNRLSGIGRHRRSPPLWGSVRLVSTAFHWTCSCGLIVAAVQLLLHDALVVQTLAGVVGDLQEAALLHHNIGLARVWHDWVLWDDLQDSGTGGKEVV